MARGPSRDIPPDDEGRSGLLRALAAAAVFALAAIANAAPAQSVLRISTPAVPDDWHVKMLYVFKDDLARAAPGRFEVQVHHSGTLFKQGVEIVAMQRGNLEMALVSMQDIARQIPEYSIFTAGYLMRDPQHLAKVYGGQIGEEVRRKVAEAMGIELLQAVYLGTRQLGLREPRRVRTPADLAGVKLRMPGSKEWLFLGQALGANPTPLAFTEVYLGLKTGTIDGQDNPIPTSYNEKFLEVTKYVVLTDHVIDYVTPVINEKLWQEMPETYRAFIKKAMMVARFWFNERVLEDEATLLGKAASEWGTEVVIPDKKAFMDSAAKFYSDPKFDAKYGKGTLAKIRAIE